MILIKKISETLHKRSGLIFSVARVRRQMKNGRYAKIIGVGEFHILSFISLVFNELKPFYCLETISGSAVYLASVLEYLVAEVCELSGHAARDNKRHSITPRHVTLAVRQDQELQKLMEKVTFAQGGVIPFIHNVLLPKRTTKKASSQEM